MYTGCIYSLYTLYLEVFTVYIHYICRFYIQFVYRLVIHLLDLQENVSVTSRPVTTEELVTMKATPSGVFVLSAGTETRVASVRKTLFFFTCFVLAWWLTSCSSPAKDSSCLSRPCENGGTCVVDGDVFNCVCKEGWEGATCSHSESPPLSLLTPQSSFRGL